MNLIIHSYHPVVNPLPADLGQIGSEIIYKIIDNFEVPKVVPVAERVELLAPLVIKLSLCSGISTIWKDCVYEWPMWKKVAKLLLIDPAGKPFECVRNFVRSIITNKKEYEKLVATKNNKAAEIHSLLSFNARKFHLPSIHLLMMETKDVDEATYLLSLNRLLFRVHQKTNPDTRDIFKLANFFKKMHKMSDSQLQRPFLNLSQAKYKFYIKLAANHGAITAKFKWAKFCLNKNPPNVTKAEILYKNIIDKANIKKNKGKAAFNLYKISNEESYLVQSASLCFPLAQHDLGVKYLKSSDENLHREGLDLLKLVADKEHFSALEQYLPAHILYKHVLKACKLSFLSLIELCKSYESGKGTKEDLEFSVECLKFHQRIYNYPLGIDKTLIYNCYYLIAKRYLELSSEKAYREKALELFTVAAHHGHQAAQIWLGSQKIRAKIKKRIHTIFK